jgi:Family of unknown function (DUF6174)
MMRVDGVGRRSGAGTTESTLSGVMRMRASFVRLAAVLAVSLGAASCDNPFSSGRLENEREALLASMSRWENRGVGDYTFVVRRSCFCGDDTTRPVRVEVRDGAVVSRTYADTGAPAPADRFEPFDTVEDLFALVGEAIENEAYEVDAVYDAVLGYPVDVAIDYARDAVDDEGGFVLTSFVVR